MFKWLFKGKARRERVRAGAELLDTLEPGWERKISLPTLDLMNSNACVLGQLGRRKGYYLDGYVAMVDELGLHGETIAHGFATDWKATGLEREYEELTKLWRKEVLERLPV